MLNKGLLPWSYFSRFLLPRPFLYESFSKYVYAWDTIKSDSDNNADWNQWDRLQNVTIKALCTSWISDLPWIFEWAQEENNRNERKSSFPSRAGSFGAPNPKEWYRRSELKTTQTHCVSKKTIRRGHQFTPPLDETLGSLVKTKQKKTTPSWGWVFIVFGAVAINGAPGRQRGCKAWLSSEKSIEHGGETQYTLASGHSHRLEMPFSCSSAGWGLLLRAHLEKPSTEAAWKQRLLFIMANLLVDVAHRNITHRVGGRGGGGGHHSHSSNIREVK